MDGGNGRVRVTFQAKGKCYTKGEEGGEKVARFLELKINLV